MYFKKTFKPALLTMVLAGCFVSSAQAADESLQEQTLGPVVVSASRVEQLQKDAIPGTILISQETIQQKKLADLPSILRSEAGIEFARNGSSGTATSLFLRGTESRQVLLLIDGVPVQDPTGTGTVETLAHLMPDQIDHIEVVKGNVSAIYGSGAVGGVVQVFTRQGTDALQANAFVEYGRYDTVKFGTNLSGKTELGTKFAFSVARSKTNGFSAMDPGKDSNVNSDADGNRNVGVTAAISQEINKDHEIGARLYYQHDKYQYDNSYSEDPEENSRGKEQQIMGALFIKDRFTSNWLSTITASRSVIKRNTWGNYYSRYLHYNVTDTSDYKGETNQLQWNNQIALNENWTVTAGGEYAHEKATTSSYSIDSYSRNKQSIYVGTLGDIGAHHIQANIRYDHVEDAGSDLTGYLGYSYDITDEWKALASISNSFQAPTMYQIANKNGGLESEKSTAAELGMQYASGDTAFRATVFEWRTRDLVDWKSDGSDPMKGSYYNVGRAKNYGVELTGSTKFLGFDLKGNVIWQNPKNRDTDERLLRRAKQTASIEVGKTWGKFYGDLNAQYSGRRKDYGGEELGSYVLVNLDGRYEINKHLSIYGRVENLFNKDYETVYGYNQTGAAAYVGINVKM